jgi:hypothetical protein
MIKLINQFLQEVYDIYYQMGLEYITPSCGGTNPDLDTYSTQQFLFNYMRDTFMIIQLWCDV